MKITEKDYNNKIIFKAVYVSYRDEEEEEENEKKKEDREIYREIKIVKG
jgi:hypothetical protein